MGRYGYEIVPMGNPMDTQKKLINENNSFDMWGQHPTPMAHSSYVLCGSSKAWNLDSLLPDSYPTLDPAIPHSQHDLPPYRVSTNRRSYSLDASKRPPTIVACVGDILLIHDHLKFKPISLHFKILNAIIIISTGYPLGIGYPMGMGMGANLCPRVLKWVGM